MKYSISHFKLPFELLVGTASDVVSRFAGFESLHIARTAGSVSSGLNISERFMPILLTLFTVQLF